jgi:hypothetical protein
MKATLVLVLALAGTVAAEVFFEEKFDGRRRNGEITCACGSLERSSVEISRPRAFARDAFSPAFGVIRGL